MCEKGTTVFELQTQQEQTMSKFHVSWSSTSCRRRSKRDCKTAFSLGVIKPAFSLGVLKPAFSLGVFKLAFSHCLRVLKCFQTSF